jgi:hypothetical protein
MKLIIESKLKAMMIAIIERFKQTPDGYCCFETDYQGMHNLLKKKESAHMSAEWQQAFIAVTVEILFVKACVESDIQPVAIAA